MHNVDVERVFDLQLAADDVDRDLAAETAGKAGGHAGQRRMPKAHPFNAQSYQ